MKRSIDSLERVASGALRRLAVETTRAYRRCLPSPGPLPDFLVVGAQKSGTTSLFGYLQQHPRIAKCRVKEVHFFDNAYHRGERWYRAHFPRADRRGPPRMVGEASAYYLCHPHAPRRIRELLPRVKLIAILRNPTERAISHYFHEVRKKRESLPILEALRAEEDRIGSEWKRMLDDEVHCSRRHRSFSYKQRGIYVEQLERYGERFDPEQILILTSEGLFRDPLAVLRQVHAFLGVDTGFVCPDVAPRNVSRNRAAVPLAVYEYLDEFFLPHNQRLYEHLGRDLGW
jgi:hypothetical protein